MIFIAVAVIVHPRQTSTNIISGANDATEEFFDGNTFYILARCNNKTAIFR
jgi:hypothetical protein